MRDLPQRSVLVLEDATQGCTCSTSFHSEDTLRAETNGPGNLPPGYPGDAGDGGDPAYRGVVPRGGAAPELEGSPYAKRPGLPRLGRAHVRGLAASSVDGT